MVRSVAELRGTHVTEHVIKRVTILVIEHVMIGVAIRMVVHMIADLMIADLMIADRMIADHTHVAISAMNIVLKA